jgi:hypothetical protein
MKDRIHCHSGTKWGWDAEWEKEVVAEMCDGVDSAVFLVTWKEIESGQTTDTSDFCPFCS